jgi:hypothetical protein
MVDCPLGDRIEQVGFVAWDAIQGNFCLIVFCRCEIFRIRQFSCQLTGIVDQNWKVLSTDLKFAILIAEYNQGNLAVISTAVDASGGVIFFHNSSTGKFIDELGVTG